MSLSSSGPGGSSAARADAAVSGLAYDARSLDGLRHASAQDREAIRQVAQQFEALFMRQLLKGMRDAVPKSGMFDGPGSDTFTSMLDTQLSTAAAAQGNGLAALIERQLLGARGDGPRSAASVSAWSPASGKPFVAGNEDSVGVPADGQQRLAQMRGVSGAGAVASLGTDSMPYQVEGRALAQVPRMSSGGVRGLPGQETDGLVTVGKGPAGHGMTKSEDGPGRAGGLQAADGQAVAGEGLTRLGPVQAAFVQRMWLHAKAAEKSTGLPAAWVVGQAALESGWGQRDIRDAQGLPSHNLFGVKAGRGWKGRTVAAVTTEYVNGVARKSVEMFRRYDSYAEAFADWASLMAANPRYRAVVEARSAREFAEGLEKGGYATDPAYGQKLKATIGSLVGAMTGRRPDAPQ